MRQYFGQDGKRVNYETRRTKPCLLIVPRVYKIVCANGISIRKILFFLIDTWI